MVDKMTKAEEVLEVLEEGDYNYNGSSLLILKEFGHVLVYIIRRVRCLEVQIERK